MADPALIPPASAADDASVCRRCPVFCDRIVYPAGCLESGCERLVVSAREGRDVFACSAGVYAVEIDLEAFELAERTRGGFGALRVRRPPLSICRGAVEEAHPHRDPGPCRNVAFMLAALRSGEPGKDSRPLEPSPSAATP